MKDIVGITEIEGRHEAREVREMYESGIREMYFRGEELDRLGLTDFKEVREESVLDRLREGLNGVKSFLRVMDSESGLLHGVYWDTEMLSFRKLEHERGESERRKVEEEIAKSAVASEEGVVDEAS